MALATNQKGILTSEFYLAVAGVLSILITNLTGHTIDASQLNDMINVIVAYIAGRSAVKSIPQLLIALVTAYARRSQPETVAAPAQPTAYSPVKP